MNFPIILLWSLLLYLLFHRHRFPHPRSELLPVYLLPPWHFSLPPHLHPLPLGFLLYPHLPPHWHLIITLISWQSHLCFKTFLNCHTRCVDVFFCWEECFLNFYRQGGCCMCVCVSMCWSTCRSLCVYVHACKDKKKTWIGEGYGDLKTTLIVMVWYANLMTWWCSRVCVPHTR